MEFLEGQYPYTINPGGPNHEELSSLIGIYDYFNNLYNHHYSDTSIEINEKILKVNKLISDHEEYIANPVLDAIHCNQNLNLIGKNKIINKNRAPTISFNSNIKTSKEISQILVNENIATRNDNFYAWRCLKALGINTDDGVVRLSMVHYNNIEESKKLVKVLKTI